MSTPPPRNSPQQLTVAAAGATTTTTAASSASSSSWTENEKAEFLQALLNRGVPLHARTNEYDWELFRTRLGSKHSSHELASNFNKILAFCRDMVTRHATSAATGKDPLASANKDGISFEKAKAIVLRLMLFFALRSAVLANPYLDHLLRNAPRPATGFPSWWTPEHDRALLLGVEIYGFEDLEAICNDAQLPFKAIASTMNATSSTAQKISELIGFPSKQDTTKRVETLCKVVQIATAQMSQLAANTTGSSPVAAAAPTPYVTPQQMQQQHQQKQRSSPQSQSPSTGMPPPVSPAISRKEKRPTEQRTAPNRETSMKHQRTDE